MNIPNIGNSGGVERGADRSARAEARRERAGGGAAAGDRAAISSDGREAKASFDAHVEAARADAGDRAEIVHRAMQRLVGGDLDSDAVMRAAAERMIATGFRAV